MSTVRVDNIEIKNNPAKFTDNIVFEVTFTCAESIKNGNFLHSIFNFFPTIHQWMIRTQYIFSSLIQKKK